MKPKAPARRLREHPNLDQLKRQAKELLEGFRAGEAEATGEVHALYHGADAATFALHDAQLVLARSYGFESWPKLKAHVDGVTVARLAELVRANELEQVRAMLEARPELANMQMAYVDERCPLHFAVMARLPEMTRLLMRHGADARAGFYPHRDATTAWTLAVERGFDDVVAVIEEEEQGRRRETSAQDEVSEAIAEGDEARAIEMLEADGRLVEGSDREGWTPLGMAAAVRSPLVVRWLLEHGAEANQRGKDGRTALDLASAGRQAIDGERFRAVAEMLRKAGAELTPRSAAALGETEWLRARQAEGTLTNSIRWDGGGLLTVAVRHDRLDVLALLLDFGFDPDEQARLVEGDGVHLSQGFPLWQAAALGRREAAEMLLARGADPSVHVDSSGTPVHSAYSHRQWEMVELLRRHGGVVGADTAALYRQTELAREMLAEEARGGKRVAGELLRFGADGGDAEIVRMAMERVDWPQGDPRWTNILLQPTDFWNHIPWLYAGNKELDRGGYIECFRLVLPRCDANAIGLRGRTALHKVAAMRDYVTEEEAAPFAEALLDAGARTDMRDEILKSTPLGWACRWGRLSVAKVLLERGADAVEADAEAWARPRAWAEKMGHGGIVALLERYGG